MRMVRARLGLAPSAAYASAAAAFALATTALALAATAFASSATPLGAQTPPVDGALPADPVLRDHAAAMAAHHLCSGFFVVGRDYRRTADAVVAEDIARFPAFQWQDDFRYEVDEDGMTATIRGEDLEPRIARYHGDQGCAILPPDRDQVYYEPVDVPRRGPDPATTPWPTGDVDAHADPPDYVDAARLAMALDWVMAQEEHNTRALVVVHGGKIIGERYATGWTRNTPQISWSQGKSITAALIGVLAEQDEIELEDPAPIAEWRSGTDPRAEIEIKDLMRMSSGLDFLNLGLGSSRAWTDENEHFRIYFDAIDVFVHATDQPMDREPNGVWRYRNSDPLTLGRIVREIVEARGGEYLTFPQRALFDRIGARNYVLETDPFGNFIMTGYDFGSAWDWARFGLLHLWDGVWDDDRILDEGWVDFVRTPAPADPNMGYGGLFWLNRGGQMPRAPEDTFYAAGYMGQFTAIIPSRDMVIVRLGPSPGNTRGFLNDIIGEVLEAFER